MIGLLNSENNNCTTYDWFVKFASIARRLIGAGFIEQPIERRAIRVLPSCLLLHILIQNFA
jgi:hypothetical protein